MLKRNLIAAVVVFSASWLQPACAQSGGLHVYEFLNLTAPARAAGMGGFALSTRADDVSLVLQNPSQLRPEMKHQLSLSYVKLPAKIAYSDVVYGFQAGKVGMLAVNWHSINYGTFTRTDENGTVLGAYTAGENAIGVSWAKALDSSLYIGADFKGVFSNLGDEKSTGIASDVGLTWYKEEHQLCAALVVKNLGTQITTYSAGRESLPFEVQAAITKQLKNAPFRFTLTGQQLQKFDLTYRDPYLNTTDPLTGETTTKKISGTEKVMRHMAFGLEVLFTKNFNLRFGYNYMRRKELAITDRKGMAGMSLGFGMRINRFGISYAHETYNRAGGDNHFTLTTDLDSFKRKSAAKD